MGTHSHKATGTADHTHTVADSHTHTIGHNHTLAEHYHGRHPSLGPNATEQTGMSLGTGTTEYALHYTVGNTDQSSNTPHRHRNGLTHYVYGRTDKTGTTGFGTNSSAYAGSSAGPNATGISTEGYGTSDIASTNLATQTTSTANNTPPYLALPFIIKT